MGVKSPRLGTARRPRFPILRRLFEPIGLCVWGYSDDPQACWDQNADPAEATFTEQQVANAITWLEQCRARGRCVYIDSYWLKHECEDWLRECGRSDYIASGAITMAAHLIGLRVRRPPPLPPGSRRPPYPNSRVCVARCRPGSAQS